MGTPLAVPCGLVTAINNAAPHCEMIWLSESHGHDCKGVRRGGSRGFGRTPLSGADPGGGVHGPPLGLPRV